MEVKEVRPQPYLRRQPRQPEGTNMRYRSEYPLISTETEIQQRLQTPQGGLPPRRHCQQQPLPRTGRQPQVVLFLAVRVEVVARGVKTKVRKVKNYENI